MTYEFVGPLGVDTVLKLPAREMPELSGAGSVFIYFDSLSNTLLSSQNGSIYSAFGGGGSTVTTLAPLTGAAASAGGADATAVGVASSAGGAGSVAVGFSASAGSASCVVLGAGAASTSTSQFVCGSGSGPISDVYFGKGVSSASPIDYTIHGTGGNGASVAGAAVRLAGGVSGDAATAGGDVRLGVSLAGSGTTTTDVVFLTPTNTGSVGIGGTPASRHDVRGTSGFRGINITADTTLGNTGATDTTYLTIDATAGNVTVTLPAVATCVNRRYKAVRTDASGNSITVSGNGAETINGSNAFPMTVQYDAFEFWNDGTAWYVF